MKLWSLLAGMLLGVFIAEANACTGVTLRGKNGDCVYGRTMEWGTFSLQSRICFFPRGVQYHAEMPRGKKGMSWKGRYGMVGIDALNREFLLDGINEKGLAAGLFYHPGFPSYVPLDRDNASRAIAPTDVLNLVLSSCRNLEDVRDILEKTVLVSVLEPSIGFPAPVHIIVTEPTGRQLIVEWMNKSVQFYDSRIGVFTNAPEYPWHLMNLRNYVHLKRLPHDAAEFAGVKFAPLGGGNQMLGMPGDFTPPSRFVRAAYFKATARPVPDGTEAIYEIFRILDNFNVPLGGSEGSDSSATAELRSDTAWTVAYDQNKKRMYYHTQNDRQVQMVDLTKINFNRNWKVTGLPLDNGRQSIKDRTPDLY